MGASGVYRRVKFAMGRSAAPRASGLNVMAFTAGSMSRPARGEPTGTEVTSIAI
jgi:hypothetical protein